MTHEEVRALFPCAQLTHFAASGDQPEMLEVMLTPHIHTTFFVGTESYTRWGSQERWHTLPAARDAWYKELRDNARAALDTVRKATYVPVSPDLGTPPTLGSLVFEARDRSWWSEAAGHPLHVEYARSERRWKAVGGPWNSWQGNGETAQEACDSLAKGLRAATLRRRQTIQGEKATYEVLRSHLKALGLPDVPDA